MYRMFLIMDGREYAIPVLPERLTVKSPGNNEKAQILEIGDINILRKKGLRELSWKALYPINDAPFVSGKAAISPADFIKAIQSQRDSLKPLRFLLIGNDLDINVNMGIEKFEYEEKYGEVGDIYYEVELKEWKNYAPQRIVLSVPAVPAATAAPVQVSARTPVAQVQAAPRPGNPPQARTYTVVRGDSLWAIAQRLYGNGTRYPEIYRANQALIDGRNRGTRNSKYTIFPGQVFQIP